jgi:excisionase family DNA binding protein
MSTLNQKEILTLKEVSAYTGLTKSHIYHLCNTGGIPFYKPFKSVYYFDRQEIISWLKQGRDGSKQKVNFFKLLLVFWKCLNFIIRLIFIAQKLVPFF